MRTVRDPARICPLCEYASRDAASAIRHLGRQHGLTVGAGGHLWDRHGFCDPECPRPTGHSVGSPDD